MQNKFTNPKQLINSPMRTALQDLRINIKESAILSKAAKTIVMAFIDNYIEEEKQQIIDAHDEGFLSEIKGDVYYTNTFNQ